VFSVLSCRFTPVAVAQGCTRWVRPLRKLADQCGLTSALGATLGRAGKFPLIDRGIALVSMAVAIALGGTSMNDITLLAHQEPVFGAAPSDTTVRRTLELADPATLDKIARARAAVRLMAARRIPHSGLGPGPKFPQHLGLSASLWWRAATWGLVADRDRDRRSGG